MQNGNFQFQDFFTESDYAIGVFDSNFKIVEASASFLELLGLSETELPVLIVDFLPDKDFDFLKYHCEKSIEGKSINIPTLSFISRDRKLSTYKAKIKRYGNLFNFMLDDFSEEQEQLNIFEKLSQKAKIGGFTYDPVADEAIWSENLFSIYGLKKTSNINQHLLLSHIVSSDLEKYKSAVDALYKDHEPYTIEVCIKGDDYKERYVRLFAEPHTKNGEVVLVTGFSQDITDEYKTRKELEQDKELISLALKGIQSGVFDHDLEKDTVNYGPIFREMVGLKENIIEPEFRKRIHPKDREKAFQRHLDELRKPIPVYKNHYRLMDKSGTYRHYEVHAWKSFDEGGNVTRMVGNLIDVHEKVTYLEQIKHYNARYNTLINNGLISTILLSQEGIIEFCDDETKSNIKQEYGFDVDQEEVSFISTLNDIEKSYFKKSFKNALKGEVVRRQISRTFRSGETRWYDIVYSPVEYSEYKITGVIINYQDITQLKLSEIEAREAQYRSEELSQLKSNFLSNMSHEIRTPLNGIVGTLELMETKTTENLPQLISLQKESVKRLTETLTGIINLSQLEASKIHYKTEELDILRICTSAFSSYEKLATERKISYSFDPKIYSLVKVEGDEIMLISTLKSVLHNALKYTKAGDSVKMILSLNRSLNTITIDIKDTGIGIDTKELGYIFESFKQISTGYGRSYEGTGIGLTTAKKYLDTIDGSITVASKLGKGSKFTINLPVKK